MAGVESREREDILFRGGMKIEIQLIGINPLQLVNEIELTHKGDGFAWFGAVFICIINTISVAILFR